MHVLSLQLVHLNLGIFSLMVSALTIFLLGFSTDKQYFHKIDSEPFLVLGDPASDEAPFFQPADVWVDGETIFVLDVDEKKIVKMDFKGKVLSSFGRKGAGPGEITATRSFALVGDTIWVPDQQLGRVSIFRDGNYEGSLKNNPIHDPTSIVVLNNKVYITGSTFSKKRIAVFDTDGNYLETLSWQTQRELLSPLWSGMRLFSYQDELLIGHIFDNALGFVSSDGKQHRTVEMEDFYPRYKVKSNGMIFPDGYSAITFSEGPDQSLLVVTCSKETRSCPTVLQLDKNQKGILGKRTFDESIWRIRYYPKQGFMVMIDGSGQVLFYGTH